MDVESLEVEARQLDRPLDRLHGQSLVHAEAELGVLLAGLDEGVRVGVDARSDADQDLLRDSAVRGHRRQTVHLLEAVHDDAPDSGIETFGELGRRLVVAVYVDAFHGESRPQGERELSATRHVEATALLGDDAAHRDAHERLTRIDDVDVRPVKRRPFHVVAQLRADGLLVHDVECGAGLMREFDHVDAADPEVPVLDLGCRG